MIQRRDLSANANLPIQLYSMLTVDSYAYATYDAYTSH